MIENRRSGDFIERLSLILIKGAFTGGFIILLDLQFTFTIYDQTVHIGAGFSDGVKGMVLQSMLLAGFAAVVAYWLDSTNTGKEQTDVMNRLASSAEQAQVAAVAAARAPAPTEAAAPIDKDAVTPAPKNPTTGNVPAVEVSPTKGETPS